MPLIYLETMIRASPQIVFDLSGSVALHKEEIIDGVQNGMMNKGDTVTWRATHLWKSRTLKVELTELEAPHFFADEMKEGDFKKMRHEHTFRPIEEGTLMIDRFQFETPFGVLGKLIDTLFLKSYMTRLLLERNRVLKKIAESSLAKQYLQA